MFILTWLGKWLLGGGIATITKELGAAYRERKNAETEQQRIEADQNIATLEAQRDILVVESANGGFASWIRPLFAFPFVLYIWVLVVWDKLICNWMGWSCSTDPLGDNLSNVMMIVLTAYFIGRSAEKTARIIKR